MAQFADGFHMVGMVVRDEDVFYFRHGQSKLMEILFQLANAQPHIDKKTCIFGK